MSRSGQHDALEEVRETAVVTRAGGLSGLPSLVNSIVLPASHSRVGTEEYSRISLEHPHQGYMNPNLGVLLWHSDLGAIGDIVNVFISGVAQPLAGARAQPIRPQSRTDRVGLFEYAGILEPFIKRLVPNAKRVEPSVEPDPEEGGAFLVFEVTTEASPAAVLDAQDRLYEEIRPLRKLNSTPLAIHYQFVQTPNR